MTMNFLASVRRNQRQWMVVLTILSIFAFLFDDVIRGANNMSGGSNALFIAVLFAGGMSIIGYSRKHTVLYGAIGFVIGGGAALIGSSFAGAKPVVRTNIGNFSRHDLNELRNRRIKAEQFLISAVRKIDKDMRAPSFGDLSDSTMVGHAILRHEAKRMGVAVSDESVNRYLKEATQDKLSEKDYMAALRENGLGEADLFDLIRGELEVGIVGRLMFPAANESQFMAQITRGQLSGRVIPQTPEELWEEFRKLNVHQSLTAVAIPVTEFITQVSEPSEAEVREFFDRYKNGVGDDRGTPGFLEFPKVKLAYLAVTNVEAYEKNLPEASDQEVVDYYLAHREEFRVLDFPDFPDTPGPKLPDLKGHSTPLGADDSPADATVPSNAAGDAVPAVQETPDEPGEKPATPEKPADPEKPSAPEKAEKPAEENPKSDAPSKQEGSQCAEDPEPAKPQETKTQETTTQEAKAEESKPADGDPVPPKPADATAKSEPSTPPAPKLPEDGVPSGAAQPVLPSPTGDLPAIPAPRYRELDELLKLEIREKILLNKTFERMGGVADKALESMMELGLKYLSADLKDREKLAESFAGELKTYAKEHGLEYHETKEMTRAELATSFDEQIGGATDPQLQGNQRRGARTVADDVFEMEQSGRAYRQSLYSPRRADTPKAKYAYWKIAEIPAKVPDLKTEAVHQKVVDAWKFEKARVKAEKRANELAEVMKAGAADIAAAMSNQTINGTPESPAVTIRETPRFTWLRTSQSLPSMGLAFPVESFIDGIDHPGPDFMKTVFDDLGEGDVGVTINRPRSVFYIVRVHDRDAANAEADGGVALQKLQHQFLKERFSNFIPTPYEFLGAETQQFVDSRWRANFNKRFGIVFEESEIRGMEE